MSFTEKSLGIALVFGLMASAAAAAQTASQAAPKAAPTKVGIVAIQQAIASTNEGKKELDALQQRFTPKQAELKNQNDEIEGLKKQLQTQGDKLSEEARATLARNIETKQKSLQRNYEDAQNDYQQAQQEILNRLSGKMAKVLENYAVKNGYTVILDVSNPQTTPVLYGSQNSNITKEIVEAYNAESPAAGAKTSGAATSPNSAGAASAAAKSGGTTTKRP